MFEWEDVETKTEIEFVLKCIYEKIWNKKIVKIFDLYGNTFNWKQKENSHVCTDDDVYIMFEDNTCIIINLVNRSAAWIKYKKLSKNEKEEFSTINDMFTFENNNFNYDSIHEFKVNSFSHEYEKWISNGNTSSMITIPAGGDYFDKITIVLKNNIKIFIQAEDAMSDGYCDIWVDNDK